MEASERERDKLCGVAAQASNGKLHFFRKKKRKKRKMRTYVRMNYYYVCTYVPKREGRDMSVRQTAGEGGSQPLANGAQPRNTIEN